MKLILKDQKEILLKNSKEQQEAQEQDKCIDFKPVVKFFTPDAQFTWLLSELDPSDEDRAFGLCDLGMGFPELGYVSLAELQSIRGNLGLPIERDMHFSPDKTLQQYADEACITGYIKT